MITRQEICLYLADLFASCRHRDDSNNGLQVEGQQEIRKIAFAVDACQAAFDQAVQREAQMLIVHHGISWGGGIKRITSCHSRRLKTLLSADLSLVAYHLPLDAHPEIGNNAVLANQLNLQERKPFFEYDGEPIGFCGALPQPTNDTTLAQILERELGGRCLILPAENNHRITRVGIVSGAGASAIEDCAKLELDCLVTGEVTHQYVHVARELGITVIAGGHYATETTGVKALEQRIASTFPVSCEFIDCPTGL
jgi:dinuclear metal center YbgI/SA1388 family protein